jgi:hypothetical protein
MIPVGYMAKRIAKRPDWVAAKNVVDIYSVSHCVSDNFANYFNFWKHNGYWFFDTLDLIGQLAHDNGIDLSGLKFFYYEAYEKQYHEDEKSWTDFQPAGSLLTKIRLPTKKNLEGYDVVSFWSLTSAECSPLSCNNLAQTLSVNLHCLLETLEEAKSHLESGRFDGSEPGPFRIFAVYSLPEVSIQFETPTA